MQLSLLDCPRARCRCRNAHRRAQGKSSACPNLTLLAPCVDGIADTDGKKRQTYKLLQANDREAAALYEGVTDEASFRRAVSRQIALFKERAKSRYVSPMFMAFLYVWLEDKEQAIAWLEKAYQEHASGLEDLKADFSYDPLHSDPRFQDLLRRLHFPP